MKAIKLKLNNQIQSFSGNGPWVIAILQLLQTQRARRGLRIREIIEALIKRGLICPGKDEKAFVSSLMQRLIKLGAVDHPSFPGGSVHYVFRDMPSVSLR